MKFWITPIILASISLGYLLGQIGGSDQLDYSGLNKIVSVLQDKYDGKLNREQLEEGARRGLVAGVGDPYTEFFNAAQAETFRQDLEGVFDGVGMEIDRREGLIIVVSPLSGFPAQKAGLLPNDVITQIDGRSTESMTSVEARDKIRGPEGTVVKLTISRQGEVLEFEIVRAKIDVASLTYKVEDGFGLIDLNSFDDDTLDLLNEAADHFKQKGVSHLILDLRSNPGGYLQTAIEVSSFWLDDNQIVVQIKSRDEAPEINYADNQTIWGSIPTVVLINEGSASASEIVAGALKHHQAAWLIGQTSFGKGSVQNLEPLPGDELLKVTIARWLDPAGRAIDGVGIEPNQPVENSDETDAQLQAAKEYLK